MKNKQAFLTVSLLVIASLLSACKKEQIRTFTLPKQSIPVAQLQQHNAPLHWEVPKNWIQKEASEFIKESYKISHPSLKSSDAQGDFSISSFPGDAGGLAANINRWRGQLKLEPQSDTQINREISIINHKMFDISYITIKSNTPIINDTSYKSILAGIFVYNDESYFFKLSGESSLLTSLESDFLSILKDIHVD